MTYTYKGVVFRKLKAWGWYSRHDRYLDLILDDGSVVKVSIKDLRYITEKETR